MYVMTAVSPHRQPSQPDGTGTDNKGGWRTGCIIYSVWGLRQIKVETNKVLAVNLLSVFCF